MVDPQIQNRHAFGRAAMCVLLAALAMAWWLGVRGDFTRHAKLLATTLQVAGGACLIAIPAGSFAALLLVRTDIWGGRWCGRLLGAMLFVPLYLQATAWEAGFGRMGSFTLEAEELARPLLTGVPAVVWIHGLAAIPWTALMMGGALWTIDRELDEAAILEASVRRTMWTTVAPRILHAAIVAALFVGMQVAAEMTVTDLYQVFTYSEEVYTLFASESDRAEILKKTAPGMLVVGWFVAAFLAMASRFARQSRASDAMTLHEEPMRVKLGGWRPAASIAAWSIVVLTACVPLGHLFFKAGFISERIGSSGDAVSGWSAARMAQSMADAVIQFAPELRTTAFAGLAAASIAMACAVPLAWLARKGGWRAIPGVMIAGTAAAIPGPLIGLFTILVFDRPESDFLFWIYDRTIVPLACALAVRGFPLALFVSWLSLRSVSDEMLDAAAAEGAGPLRRLGRIGLAQRWRPLVAGWWAVFAYSIGDVAASALVVPPNMQTVSYTIFQLIHQGVRNQEAALCLISAAIFVAIAALAGSLIRPASR